MPLNGENNHVLGFAANFPADDGASVVELRAAMTGAFPGVGRLLFVFGEGVSLSAARFAAMTRATDSAVQMQALVYNAN